MSATDDLVRALDGMAAADDRLALWWRDDDLEKPGPDLDRMLACLDDNGVVPALAAIPATLRAEAVDALADGEAAILVHGWRHVNHAPEDEKKSEYGAHRPLDTRLAEIVLARQRLAEVAGTRMVPCFVPPWNRIADDLAGAIGGAGIVALSAFASAKRPPAPAGVPRLDTHVDLIDWRGSRHGVSAEVLAKELVKYVGVDGPVGILSHHRVTDGRDWDAWGSVLGLLSSHPGVRWLTPQQALAAVGAVGAGGV